MLQHLYIRNYALIKELNIDFGDGFSVITGETGAGKSILLGAINLLLGQRADMKALQDSAEKCVIEATFNLEKYNLKSLFDASELDYEEECIIRRDILPSGKSRAFINDTPVQLTILRDIGTHLLDIHSQHQNLLINKAAFVLNFVDTIAGSEELLAKYRKSFFAYQSAKKELDEFVSLSDKAKEEEEYIRFQLSQLTDARIQEDEQETLEEEANLLTHAEEIKSGLFSISEMFDSDSTGIIQNLKKQLHIAHSIEKVYPQAEEIAKRIESSYIELKDLSYEVAGAADDINFDPERLEFVNNRLDTLYSLQQRYRVNSNKELLDIASQLQAKLNAIESHDNRLEELTAQVEASLKAARSLAAELTEKRKAALGQISNTMIGVLQNLGMPNVRLEIECSTKDQLSSDGADVMTMLFSANKNRTLQDISEIASGGEIARVMLAIKYMICKVKVLPTIFFDEIDTGVSGEIADKMGKIMKDMGENMQVVSITHLPQIASRGERQYKVYKNDSNDDTTTSNIRLLTQEERINEIAVMLSGSTITDAAINNAKELLKND